MMIPKRRLLTLISACLCFKKSFLIKTNCIEAIIYFRLSIAAIVLFDVFTFAGSQTEKELRWCQRAAYILVWQPVWIMKLLHDSVYNPLKQTKRTPALVLCQAYNSSNKRNIWKGIPIFLVGKFQAEFGFHVFKPFLNISFRLSRPFFVKRNWLRQMVNAITERNQN